MDILSLMHLRTKIKKLKIDLEVLLETERDMERQKKIR